MLEWKWNFNYLGSTAHGSGLLPEEDFKDLKTCSSIPVTRIEPGVMALCFDETFQLSWQQEEPPNPGTGRTGPEMSHVIVL